MRITTEMPTAPLVEHRTPRVSTDEHGSFRYTVTWEREGERCSLDGCVICGQAERSAEDDG